MAKTVVEDCLVLDINRLNRDSKGKTCLIPGLVGTIGWSDGKNQVGIMTYTDSDDQLILRLDYVKKGESLSIPITIQWTPIFNGGKRPWFTCPAVVNNIPCQRRVGKLYLPGYGKYFACRHCYDLAYQSQQEWTNPKYKALFDSLTLMEQLDSMTARKKRLSDKEHEIIRNKYDQLYQKMRKAGLIDNDK